LREKGGRGKRGGEVRIYVGLRRGEGEKKRGDRNTYIIIMTGEEELTGGGGGR